MMTLLDVMTDVRDRLSDRGGDGGGTVHWQTDDSGCRWKNDELTRYLNQVLRELGQRHPIKDRANYPLALSAGKRGYELEPEIVRVDSVTRLSDGNPLVKTTVAELQAVTVWNRHNRETLGHDWRNDTGFPTHYLLDEQQGYLTVYPTPIVDMVDALRRQVWRTYTSEVRWPADASATSPAIELDEVPDHYFEILLAGICARAYTKGDADTYMPKLADRFEAEFNRRVGTPFSLANLEADHRWADTPGDTTPRTYFSW